MMNTTTTPAAIAAAKQALNCARLTEAAVRIEHDKAAGACRKAENDVALARQGAVGSPEAAALVDQAEDAFREAFDIYQKSKNDLAVAEAAALKARQHLEEIEKLPLAIPSPTDEERDDSLANESGTLSAAGAEYRKAQAKRADLDAQLAALENKRIEILQTRGSIEGQGAALAGVMGEIEILKGQIPEADSKVEASAAVYAFSAARVQSELNTRFYTLRAEAGAVARGLVSAVNAKPLDMLLGRLATASALCDQAKDPARKGIECERFLAVHKSLSVEIESMCEDLRKLANDITSRLHALEAKAAKVIDVEGSAAA